MSLRRFFFGSVRRQLVFGVAAVHAVMMSLFVWDLATRQREFLLLRQTEQAETLTQTLAVSAVSGLLTHDVAGMQELVNAQDDYPGIVFVMLRLCFSCVGAGPAVTEKQKHFALKF